MPRVADVYAVPAGTDGISNGTISSSKYNGFVHDVESDLNLARPILAGGTGANSASGARTNLNAEVAAAGQQVTNYNSQVWEAGSFLSAPGATGAPTANAFFGTAILNGADQGNIVLEARDTTTGLKYTRTKSGTWGAWTNDSGSDKLPLTGGTLTGNLTISKPAGSFAVLTINSDPAQRSYLTFAQGGLSRWNFYCGPSGDNSLHIERFNPAGTFIGDAMFIDCATGITTVLSPFYVNAPSGHPVVSIRSAGVEKAQVGYNITGNLAVLVNMAAVTTPLAVTTGGIVQAAQGIQTRPGQGGAYNPADCFNFFWSAPNLQAWINSTNVGNVTLTCDYRTKENVRALTSTWDKVRALNPIVYSHTDYQSLFKKDGLERWGFIAHELQDTLLPTAATGSKDEENLVQSPDLMSIVAALTKALQEAMARIETLEARQ